MPLLNPRNLLYLVRASLRRWPRFAITYFMESVAFDLAYGTNTHLRVPKPDQKEIPGSDWKDGLLYVALDPGLVSKEDYHAAMRPCGRRRNWAGFWLGYGVR